MPERSSRSHTSSTASCSRCPGGRESSPDTSPPPSSRKSVSTRGAQRAENRVQLCADRAGEAALEHVRPVPGRAERQMPPVGVELLGRHGTVRVDPVHDLPASCSSSAGGNVAPNPREAGRRGRGRQGRTRDRRPPPGRAGTRRPASARPPRPVAPRPAPDAGAPEVPGHRDPRAELHDGADPTARLTPHDRRSAYTSTAASSAGSTSRAAVAPPRHEPDGGRPAGWVTNPLQPAQELHQPQVVEIVRTAVLDHLHQMVHRGRQAPERGRPLSPPCPRSP